METLGYDDLIKRLTEMDKKGNAIANTALRTAAGPVMNDMVERAPKRRGRGKEAIKVGRISTLKGGKVISIGIHKAERDDGLHMYYQEYGTSRHPAHPFIRPAFESKKKEAFDLIKAEAKKGLGL